MKTATAYVRVSTTLQATEGISLDAQRARIEAWAQSQGITVSAVYVDAGLSGGRADNRPELIRALDAVTRAKGILVVYSLSRLARSTRDTLAIAERLDHAGADLVSLSEKIDTTSAAGRMVFRMLAVLAEFERDLTSERTSSALRSLRARGKRAGAVPFGYHADASGSLVGVPAEQAALVAMRDLRARGASYREIGATLEARGVATKSGGTKWHPETVRSVLAHDSSTPAA